MLILMLVRWAELLLLLLMLLGLLLLGLMLLVWRRVVPTFALAPYRLSLGGLQSHGVVHLLRELLLLWLHDVLLVR